MTRTQPLAAPLLRAHRSPAKEPGDDDSPQPMPVDPDEGPVDPPPSEDPRPGRPIAPKP